MHIQTVLEQLGLSLHEAKVYLAALKAGSILIADLASEVKIPRSTVVETVQSLHKRGLMHYYIQRGRKHWHAENPDKLAIGLEEKKAALAAIMPNLKGMRALGGGQAIVRLFAGEDEIKQIMDDIIETKHHIMGLVSWDDWVEMLGMEFTHDFIERRKAHNLKMKLITPATELAHTLKKNDSVDLRHTKFLPSHIDLRYTSNFIYGGKSAVISLNRKRPTGLIIDDPDAAHAAMIYFESLWLHSTEQ